MSEQSPTNAPLPSVEGLLSNPAQLQAAAMPGNHELEGSKSADLIIAGTGNTEIEAGKGNDIVVDLGGSDKIDLGKGNDTLIYDVAANAGARDRADGGAGADTLALALTGAEWFSTALQTDVARLQAILSLTHHDHGAGLERFNFSAFNLSVRDFEAVRIFVDGQEISLADNAVLAVADAATVAEGGSVSGNVLTNDSVPDLIRSVALINAPTAGALTFAADGSFTFDAAQGFDWLAVGQTQTVTFVYRVTDADGDFSDATVTLTITGTNDVPVISGTASGAVVEDVTLTASGQLTATDADLGDVVVFSGAASSALGAFAVDASGAWSYVLDATASQSLAAGQVVSEVFTVTATDTQGATATQDVTITITGTNDAPVISGTASGAVVEDVTLTASGQLTASDADLGDVVVFSGAASSALGAFAVDASGAWSYVLDATASQSLAAGQVVSEVFTVTATDTQGATATQDVTINITGTNDAPVFAATQLSASTDEDSTVPLQGVTSAMDADAGDQLIYSGAEQGAYGTFSVSPAGAWAYTVDTVVAQALAEGQVVTEVFTVTATDAQGATGQQAVTITITGTNDAPVMTGFTSVTAPGQASGQLTGTDPDAGDVATWTGTATGVYGDLTVATGGAWVYTAEAGRAAYAALAEGQVGAEDFVLTVSDGHGGQTQYSFAPEVVGVNDAPTVAGDLAGMVAEDVTPQVSGQLTAADVDMGDSAVFAGTANGSYGAFVITPQGGWSYALDATASQSLAAGQVVSEVFAVTATDSFGAVVMQAVTLTITGSNDAPVISATSAGAVVQDSQPNISGQVAASDVDAGAVLAYAGDASGTYGSFAINPQTGAWTFALNAASPAVQALAAGQVVTETFTVTVSDGQAAVQTPVTLTITGSNDAPTVSGNSHGAVAENAAPTVSGQLIAHDIDAGAVVAWSLAPGAPVQANPLMYMVSGVNGQLTAFNPATHVTTALGTPPGFGTNAAGYDEATDTIWAIRTNANVLVQYSTTGAVLGQFPMQSLMNLSGSIAASFGPDGLLHVLNGNQLQAINVQTQTLAGVQTLTGAVTSQLTDIAYNPLTHAYVGIAGGRLYAINAVTGVATLGPVTTIIANANAIACDPAGNILALQNNSGVVQINPVTGQSTLLPPAFSFGAGDAAMSIDPSGPGVAGNGIYGALVIDAASGQWTYTLDNARTATQALRAGQVVTDTITVIATDEHGAAVAQQIVVNIQGSNDAPVLTGAQPAIAASITEGVTGNVFGQITATDPDLGAVLSFTTNSAGQYGALALNPATGAWIYAPAQNSVAVNALAAGQVVQDSFAVTVSDGQGGSVQRNLVFRITGTNDAPIVTGTTTGAVSQALASTSGALTITDAEGDAISISTSVAPAYGSFAVDAAGGWTYALNTAGPAYLGLAVGSVVTDSATVQISDGHGGTVNQVIAVQVSGPVAAPQPVGITPFAPGVVQDNTLQATATGYIVNGVAVTMAQPVADIFVTAPDPGVNDNSTLAGTFTGTGWATPTLHYTGGNGNDGLTLFNAKALDLDVNMGAGDDVTYLSLGQLPNVIAMDGGLGADLLYLASGGLTGLTNGIVDLSQFATGQITVNGQTTQFAGYERLFLSNNSNTVIGSAGDDVVSDGGAGTYFMGAGNDNMSVMNSNFFATTSTYNMEDGNDVVSFVFGQQISNGSVVNGGAGLDTVIFNNVASLQASAAGDSVALGAATVALLGVEKMVINGDANANLIVAGGLSDQINGGAGDDTLIGGAGDDLLDSGSGNNTIATGLGNDVARLNGTLDHVIYNNGDGYDVFQFFDAQTGADHDVIEIHGVVDGSGVAINSFATLAAHAFVDSLGSVHINFGTGQEVYLAGVGAADFSADDFLFT